jgi:hypothetical protein
MWQVKSLIVIKLNFISASVRTTWRTVVIEAASLSSCGKEGCCRCRLGRLCKLSMESSLGQDLQSESAVTLQLAKNNSPRDMGTSR